MYPNDQLNLTEYCFRSYKKSREDKPALIIVDDIGRDRVVNYSSLYHDVCCLTQGLKSLQLAKSMVVCIQADEVYDLLLLFLAANAAGLVPCPLLLSLSSKELNFILSHSNARVFFRLNRDKAELNIPKECLIVTADGYNKLIKFPFQEIQATTYANDPAFLFYTSGSAGLPKGVLHAQHSILGRKPSLENWLTLQANDIVLQTDNLCWTYSMFTGFLDPLSMGATALIMTQSQLTAIAEDKVSGGDWLKIINHYRVNIIVSTPDIYFTIVTSPFIVQFKNQSLRQAGSAGAMLSDHIQQLWQSHFNFPIFIALGMSELSTFISMGPKIPYRKNTLGKIQPGRKVTILPIEDGLEPVAINELGMLVIHEDELGFMLGYVGEPREGHKLYRGTWFLTQDIVSRDEDEYIHFYGRNDLIVKVDGGFRVSPAEVENILQQFHLINDAACGSLVDQDSKSAYLVAYVVTEKPSHEVAEEIHQFLLEQISDYKVPRYVYFVRRIPRTSHGKVIRKNLSQLVPLQKYRIK